MTRARLLPSPLVRALIALAALAGALLSGVGTREPADPPAPVAKAVAAAPQRDVFADALPQITKRLNRERLAARRALAAGTTGKEQARGARRAAAAYAGAARRVAAVKTDDPRRKRAVAALRRVEREYQALARAAAAGNRSAFARAARAIERHERQVRRLLFTR